MNKILIIQTAFIGDVILATVLIEKLKALYPAAEIDFLLRAGNESLLHGNPGLNKVIIWNKRKNKYQNLLKIILQVRKKRYDLIVNPHRFSSSGFICWFSRAAKKTGFDKNPLSFCYNVKVNHEYNNGIHETERDLLLIDFLSPKSDYKPKLYFSREDEEMVLKLVSKPYVVLAPASVWFTKQLPKEKWIEVVKKVPENISVVLIGGGNDVLFCEDIIRNSSRQNSLNLAGKLSFLESAALMKNAEMNYVNDSAPMHIASSVNAPTTAIFCSTIPGFGFGPLSDQSRIWQTNEKLDCRPCGLHGFKTCPVGHFNCAKTIVIPENVLN